MAHRFTSLVAASVVSLVVAAGCSPGGEEPLEIRVGHGQQSIEGGYFDDVDTHAVGVVHFENFDFGACSGTLIAPNVVLTAQHCVAPTSTGGSVQCGLTQFGGTHPAASMFVTTEATFSQNPADYHSVREIHLPGGPQFCGFDQAIMILNGPIDAAEAVPATPRVDAPLISGEEYYAIGYGQQGNGPSGERRRRDDLFLNCVGSFCGTGQISVEEWLGDTGVCSGDSGGPAFDMADRVIGVASRGSDGCETPIYGDVSAWGQWIKDTTIYAASLLGQEAPDWANGWPTDPAYHWPIGGECTDHAECESGVCANSECSRWCAETAPCPEGYECLADGYCLGVAPPPEELPANKDDVTVKSGCTYSAGQDPTKPIPWKWAALIAGLAWLGRRRRD